MNTVPLRSFQSSCQHTMFALYLSFISLFIKATDERVIAPLSEAVRNPSTCTGAAISTLATETVKTLNQRRDLAALEKLQLIHATCGSYLKTQDAARYKQWFYAKPKYVTDQQWKDVYANKLLEGAVATLRAAPTASSLCATAGNYRKVLETVAFHDIIKAVICHLCGSQFLKNNNTAAYNTVCATQFVDTVTSLLKEVDCDNIGKLGRSLKVLPGYLKLKVAQICERQFLGTQPFEDDIVHLKAWMAITGGDEDAAFAERYKLLRSGGKSTTIFATENEED
jgi:hypothetical protein